MKEYYQEFVFDEIPDNMDSFKSKSLDLCRSPQGATAMFILSLYVFSKNYELGLDMLNFMKFEDSLSVSEIENEFKPIYVSKKKIASSYFKGATPENNYEPSLPLTISVRDSNTHGKIKGLKTVYVGCSGIGTYRPITLKLEIPKKVNKWLGIKSIEDDMWFAADYPSILLDI